MALVLPDTMTLTESLASLVCPSCGKTKKYRQTFCPRCYFALPRELKARLYDRIGEGYEQALQDAFTALNVTAPHWPA